MAGVNLSGMTVEALMDLRKRGDEMLLKRRAELEKQLERMEAIAVVGGGRRVRGGGSDLRGERSRRNIVVLQAKPGQDVAQNLVGLLLRSKVERNSRTS